MAKQPSGLLCPKCNHNEWKVLETRTPLIGSIHRRRKCRSCGHTVRSVERIESMGGPHCDHETTSSARLVANLLKQAGLRLVAIDEADEQRENLIPPSTPMM